MMTMMMTTSQNKAKAEMELRGGASSFSRVEGASE